jgi:hypothetical protein
MCAEGSAMTSFERRLSRLAAALGGYRPLCPDCGNAPVNIIIDEDLEDETERVTGERCKTCGSPDALVIRLVYDDEPPGNPGAGLKDLPYEQ